MKITIALPAYHNHPIGGYIVNLKYANLLVAKGHEVTVVFPMKLTAERTWGTHFSTLIWVLKKHIKNRPLMSSFSLDPRVRVKLICDLTDASLPDSDILIATAWQTAESLKNASQVKGRKFYLLYDYEHWMTANPSTRLRIESTFTLPFKVITTSSCVREMLESSNGKAFGQIFCGLDFVDFGMDISPVSRNPFTVGFPIRGESFKGLDDAIAAAEILRVKFGEKLIITAFGRNRLNLPSWIQWVEAPTQSALRKFYNENAIFLLPSHFEGWGLPGVEAMASGAALVVTDNGGSRDYAFNEVTALVVEPKNPAALADGIGRLITDQPMRLALAAAGNEFVQRFSWDQSGEALQNILLA